MRPRAGWWAPTTVGSELRHACAACVPEAIASGPLSTWPVSSDTCGKAAAATSAISGPSVFAPRLMKQMARCPLLYGLHGARPPRGSIASSTPACRCTGVTPGANGFTPPYTVAQQRPADVTLPGAPVQQPQGVGRGRDEPEAATAASRTSRRGRDSGGGAGVSRQQDASGRGGRRADETVVDGATVHAFCGEWLDERIVLLLRERKVGRGERARSTSAACGASSRSGGGSRVRTE